MLTLREGDDENAQLAALSELCELLAVSSEDALAMVPVDSLVPVLVRPRSSGAGTCLTARAPPPDTPKPPSVPRERRTVLEGPRRSCMCLERAFGAGPTTGAPLPACRCSP